MKGSGAAVLGLVLLIAGAFTFVLTQPRPGGGGNRAEARCTPTEEHECLPDLGYLDTSGRAWTADALAGKVVIVNFWATWCKPCVHEIPLLSRTFERYGDQGVVLLGVLTDDPSDAVLARFVAQHRLRYPIVRADQGIMEAFDYPDALPTTFIYDRHGELARRYLGPLSQQMLDRWLPPLLEQQ